MARRGQRGLVQRGRRALVVVLAVVAVLAALPATAAGAAGDPREPGQLQSGQVTSNGATSPYLLYTPRTYDPARRVPLVVVVHGCQTTADQMRRATRFDALAEREGFVVLYPEVDVVGRLLPGPLHQCWKFPYPLAWGRGGSDAAAIHDMTRAVMAQRSIDLERVYAVGVSAGGLMTSILAAAYPDVDAAVGVVQSAGYLDFACFTTGIGIPVSTSAQLARLQMGPRARVVPRFVVGSTDDTAFPASCAAKATEQGLRTTNLVLSGRQDRPLSLQPASVVQRRVPGGRSYTVSRYDDPAGCLVAEHWLIDGMPHAWPGGTTDRALRGFTDASAPSGAEGAWAFFERYRRSDTAPPCATTARH